ncbi:MAG: glycosyltransferase family 2 protein [Synergistaceae bacterium]|jgi:glycosyltransferase involved in cell wall biosynthesis|nr:glycosyltransferase family 2 protein [Synergistaceae bacterium]
MHIPKLSLFIITKNEERRLPMVLESVKGLADEIVIVDSGSTDGTERVAERYGARFIYHEWESYDLQAKWAEEQCAHRWVLRLDADEVISSELAEEIMEVRRTGTKDAYWLRIADMIVGRSRPNPWVWHYKRVRLYHRGAYSMTGTTGHDVAQKIDPNATEELLKGFVHHFSFLSIYHLIQKHNFYSSEQIRQAVIDGKNYSPWRMVGAMSFNFLKRFIIDRFFLYGFWGFIYSMDYAFLRFLKFSKFYEHNQLVKYKYPPKDN